MALDGTGPDSRGRRGLSPLVSVLMMVGVTLVVSVVVVVGAMAFLPDDGSVSVRPEADFTIEHEGGALSVDPQYMTEGVPFTLLINGKEVYTWEGGNTERERELRCLNVDDSVHVRAETEGQRTYLIEDHDVESRTDCGLSGSASRFAYAQVGARQVPLEDPDYAFTLAIDPDGPNSVNGDTDYPTTNPWNYIQRYDRTVEGLDPPVYVVVFADNADWDAEPSGTPGEDSFTVDGSGDLSITPSGSEPTNDVYLIFEPGCDESTFKYLTKEAAYDNQILLDGTELFVADDSLTEGKEYTGPGVDCT